MISNYIKFAWRNLTKNKIFSFINIVGLAIGLACCMLIAIFVYDELSYDRYPSQTFNIYRLGLKATANGEVVDVAVGPSITDTFPEVLVYTRLVRENETWVRHAEKQFTIHLLDERTEQNKRLTHDKRKILKNKL